jgi:hypothetical protein
MSDWKQNFDQALRDAGVPDTKTWIAQNPGKHLWFQFLSNPSCACCGVIRRGDDTNKPCSGIMPKITTR